MAHTLVNGKALSLCDAEEPEISIIDPEQEDEIARLREQLMHYWKSQDHSLPNPFDSVIPVLKRKRPT